MKVEVLLPQWGMGMSEGLVVQWNKKVGDTVTEGELRVQENERAKVRTVLGVIESPD